MPVRNKDLLVWRKEQHVSNFGQQLRDFSIQQRGVDKQLGRNGAQDRKNDLCVVPFCMDEWLCRKRQKT